MTSIASLSTCPAASSPLLIALGVPSPAHSHRAATARRTACRFQSSFDARIAARSAAHAALTCPAATSVANAVAAVAPEPRPGVPSSTLDASRSAQCLGFAFARARYDAASRIGGDATASASASVRNFLAIARALDAEGGSASSARTSASATSPHVALEPSAKAGSHRRIRASSASHRSSVDARTRDATASGTAFAARLRALATKGGDEGSAGTKRGQRTRRRRRTGTASLLDGMRRGASDDD